MDGSCKPPWYDIALREDEGWSMRRVEINAINADIQNAPLGQRGGFDVALF